MLAVLDVSDDDVAAQQAVTELERTLRRNFLIPEALDEPDGAGDRDRVWPLVQNLHLSAIIEQRLRHCVRLSSPSDHRKPLVLDLSLDRVFQCRPNQSFREIRIRGNSHKSDDGVLAPLSCVQHNPSTNTGSHNDHSIMLMLLLQPVDQGCRILRPASDGSVLVFTVTLSGAKIISHQEAAAVTTAPSLDGICLGTMPRLIERWQIENYRAISGQVVILDFSPINVDPPQLTHSHFCHPWLGNLHGGSRTSNPAY
mmetsp:Transcript_17544/g.39685  ORF Transcript_17544/g.39685 Transcript_17544/m.39685 type:complete len:255 (+) Transcript_17544:243-1007(+)